MATLKRVMITEATAENRAIPNPEQQLADLTLRLRNQFIDRQLAALSQSLHQPEIPEEESTRLLQQQQRLREMKRHPLSPLGDQ